MIVEYHRPETLQSALVLLSRKYPRTVPLGGGTHLSHYQGDPIAVVDLSKLDLGKIERAGDRLRIGSTATLQSLIDFDGTPPDAQGSRAFRSQLQFTAIGQCGRHVGDRRWEVGFPQRSPGRGCPGHFAARRGKSGCRRLARAQSRSQRKRADYRVGNSV